MDSARHGPSVRSQHVPDTRLCAIKTKRLGKKKNPPTYRRPPPTTRVHHVRTINMGSERGGLSGSVTLQEFDFYGPKIHVGRLTDANDTGPIPLSPIIEPIIEPRTLSRCRLTDRRPNATVAIGEDR